MEEKPISDPVGVHSEAEMLAAIRALSRQRDKQSLRHIERAASKNGLHLPHSAVGDILDGKFPPKERLMDLLTILGVPAENQSQWEAAWERVRMGPSFGPPGAIRVAEAKPRLLGVHASIRVEGTDEQQPPMYVNRDADLGPFGLRSLLENARVSSGFLLLVGGSSTGKTRCAFEAVREVLSDWWLFHPEDAAAVKEFAANQVPKTVLWLDELQNFIGSADDLVDSSRGRVLASDLRRLLTLDSCPIVIIGTIWPRWLTAYIRGPHAESHDEVQSVVRLARQVLIDSEFSQEEFARAREIAKHDARISRALRVTDYGLTQALAAAPELISRWEYAKVEQPYAWAVMTAALDVSRLVGARIRLSAALLRQASVGYCSPERRADAKPDWFECALSYATDAEGSCGASRPLQPVAADMDKEPLYVTADYLTQHATTVRDKAVPPESFWRAVIDHVKNPAVAAILYAAALRFNLDSVAMSIRPLIWQRFVDTDDDSLDIAFTTAHVKLRNKTGEIEYTWPEWSAFIRGVKEDPSYPAAGKPRTFPVTEEDMRVEYAPPSWLLSMYASAAKSHSSRKSERGDNRSNE